VISALARIDNPLPMPATVHDFRGQSHVRHRAPFAGIPDESRRGLAPQRVMKDNDVWKYGFL